MTNTTLVAKLMQKKLIARDEPILNKVDSSLPL